MEILLTVAGMLCAYSFGLVRGARRSQDVAVARGFTEADMAWRRIVGQHGFGLPADTPPEVYAFTIMAVREHMLKHGMEIRTRIVDMPGGDHGVN